MYDYSDINSYIQSQTGKDGSDDFIFTLYFDMTIFQVVILMHEDYEFDLSEDEFARLVGYDKEILRGTTFVGARVPDITRSVDWVFLHCDLISRLANDVSSDVLYSFSTSEFEVSHPFQKEPIRLEWHPVNKSAIDKDLGDGRERQPTGSQWHRRRGQHYNQEGVSVFISSCIYTMNHPSEWARFFDENTGRYRYMHKGSGLVRDALTDIGKAFTGTSKTAVEKGSERIQDILRTRKAQVSPDARQKLANILQPQAPKDPFVSPSAASKLNRLLAKEPGSINFST